MVFTSLEQRMAQTYIDMFPKFIPDKDAQIDIAEQERFYNIMKNLYQLAFNEPLLFVPTLHEDDAYPNRFNKSSYGKPELYINMRKFLKSIEALLLNMYALGKNINVNINKVQLEILSKLGINELNNLPPAWIWMANRPESNISEFKYCLFDRNYIYTKDIYANLLGESSFKNLDNWMISHGYRRHDIYNITASDCKLSLTYANPLWNKNPPSGGFEYKIKHTGISIRYDQYFKNPTVFGLCIPTGWLKVFLNNFNSMEINTQKFIISHNKKCNGCRYCVQTDKTNTRPFAYVTINYEGINNNLCTYFPGYSYCWTSINDELAKQIIDILTFMDKYIPEEKVVKKRKVSKKST